jgi:proline dehydrogenase
MTADDFTAAGIPLPATDAETVLTAASALEWIQDNTTIDLQAEDQSIDQGKVKAMPVSAKLFVLRFTDAMMQQAGVASESLSGLSQSFRSDTTGSVVRQYAEELLGPYLKSQVTFTAPRSQWL